MTVESSDVRAAKRVLRAELLARRLSRSPADRERLGHALTATALAQPQLAAAGCACGYVGVDSEPATRPLLEALRDAGTTVLLPVLASERTLDWAEYRGPNDLVPAAFALLQPAGARHGPDAAASADVILLPALAVDLQGRRLGRGGGYYDRLLARLAGQEGLTTRDRPGAEPHGGRSTWAVVYDDEVLAQLPAEAHDLPVRGALTPGGFRSLRPD